MSWAAPAPLRPCFPSALRGGPPSSEALALCFALGSVSSPTTGVQPLPSDMMVLPGSCETARVAASQIPSLTEGKSGSILLRVWLVPALASRYLSVGAPRFGHPLFRWFPPAAAPFGAFPEGWLLPIGF